MKRSTVLLLGVLASACQLRADEPIDYLRDVKPIFAKHCTMCHGARGMSEANSPNLAGQYPAVISKELRDIKSGARESAVMAPLVAPLSDQDMRDLAAYYAYLPRPPPYHPSGEPPKTGRNAQSGWGRIGCQSACCAAHARWACS